MTVCFPDVIFFVFSDALRGVHLKQHTDIVFSLNICRLDFHILLYDRTLKEPLRAYLSCHVMTSIDKTSFQSSEDLNIRFAR